MHIFRHLTQLPDPFQRQLLVQRAFPADILPQSTALHKLHNGITKAIRGQLQVINPGKILVAQGRHDPGLAPLVQSALETSLNPLDDHIHIQPHFMGPEQIAETSLLPQRAHIHQVVSQYLSRYRGNTILQNCCHSSALSAAA